MLQQTTHIGWVAKGSAGAGTQNPIHTTDESLQTAIKVDIVYYCGIALRHHEVLPEGVTCGTSDPFVFAFNVFIDEVSLRLKLLGLLACH